MPQSKAGSTFGERFGYALWLAYLRDGAMPTWQAIADAVGRTRPAVKAWLDSSEPPTDWKVHEPLAQFLGVPDGWIIKQAGAAPIPPLWEAWLAARRGNPIPGAELTESNEIKPLGGRKPGQATGRGHRGA